MDYSSDDEQYDDLNADHLVNQPALEPAPEPDYDDDNGDEPQSMILQQPGMEWHLSLDQACEIGANWTAWKNRWSDFTGKSLDKMDVDDLKDLMDGLNDFISGTTVDGNSRFDYRTISYILYDAFQHDILEPHALSLKYKQFGVMISEMVRRATYADLMTEYEGILGRVWHFVHASYNMLQNECTVQIMGDPARRSDIPSGELITVMTNALNYHERQTEVKPHQAFYLHVLQMARERNYRRTMDGVYVECTTPEGYRTHFWRKLCSLEKFVTDCMNPNENFEQWKNATDKSLSATTDQIIKQLSRTVDPDFPLVRKDRHIFSFRNGVYVAHRQQFIPYTDGTLLWSSEINEAPLHNEVNMTVPDLTHQPTNAAANYFPHVDFDTAEYDDEAYYKIPTPAVSQLLHDQGIPDEAQKVWWAFLGRMLYEVGELDNWQILPWILGKAGTGKSTLCKVITYIYQQEDVGVLSNNMESQFGLQSLLGKFAFIAGEIKRDFKLPQAEFQSMVVGEPMSIAVKYKTAVQATWVVPGMLAGNVMPAWMDHSASITRRIAVFEFNKKIPDKDVDSDFDNHIRREIANCILKANLGYHWHLKDYGHRGIWKCLPDYFTGSEDGTKIGTRMNIKSACHPVHNFLQHHEGKLLFSKDAYMPLHEFRRLFLKHCKNVRIKSGTWGEELYQDAFAEHNLTVETRKSCTYRGTLRHNLTVVNGVKANPEAANDDEERGARNQVVNPYQNDGSGQSYSLTLQTNEPEQDAGIQELPSFR